jgi:UDP-N-acetylglucosamine--N-acetylmuramyl-(pentapeptide) pyrophosphoryl-undecaprenol N-acetylglucosamine transferase
MAAIKNIPTLIQEQNSYPGITNKLLSKKVDKICVAYDELDRFFPKDKIVKTGNPVRQDLLTIDEKRKEAKSFFKLDNNKKTLLVLGGSLGARAINHLIKENLDDLLAQDVQIIWQTGKLYIDEYQKFNDVSGVQTYAFLNKMDLAYAAADIIISRAGAGSISELCMVGKPVIFIPSPNVTEDHQTKNAQAIVKEDAAVLIKENELDTFLQVFKTLVSDDDKQKSLADNIKKLELPKATQQIVEEVKKIIKSE